MAEAPRSNRPTPRTPAAIEAELRRRIKTDLEQARSDADGELDDAALAGVIAHAIAEAVQWHLEAPEHTRNATLSSRSWRPAGGPRGGPRNRDDDDRPGPRDFDRPPPRDFDRGPRDFDRGPRDFGRPRRDFDRPPPRDFDRPRRDFDRDRDFEDRPRGDEGDFGPRPRRGGYAGGGGGGGGFRGGGFRGGGGGFKRGGFGPRRPPRSR